MKHKQIYSFDSIAGYKIFSKQSHDYEKVLGNRTLKAFIKNLKRPKKIKKLSFLEELLKKYPKAQKDMEESEAVFIHENQDNSLLEKYNIDKYKEDKYYRICGTEKKLYDKEKNNENVTEIVHIIHSKKKPKINIDKSYDMGVDPFKYNPNYNSIFKYIPCARLDRPNFANYENKKTKSTKNNNHINKNRNLNMSLNNNTKSVIAKTNTINNTNIDSNKNILKTTDNISKNNFNSEKKFPKYKRNIFITKKNNDLNEPTLKNSSFTNKKTNSAVKLPKIKKEKININSEKILYISKKNTKNNSNNALSFRKMLSRKEKDMIYAQALEVPSFYNYSPNYNYIEKAPMNISFVNKNEMSENDKKKFLMKKLWTSYNVDLEYHLITNSNWK